MVRTFVVVLLAAALQAGVIQKLRLSDVGPPPSSEEVRSLLSSILSSRDRCRPYFSWRFGVRDLS